MVARKSALILLSALLIVLPASTFATDNRGIAITSDAQTQTAGWGNYHALIIGINAYKEWNPLQTAVKDAEVLRDVLIKRYGFAEKNVILRTDKNATRYQIIRDLRNIATSLEKSDNLLIYYAGHGQLDDITGDGYWIPVEGKLKDSSTWISQYIIKSILSSQKVSGKNIVVVADSCYSGTMLRGGPSLLTLDAKGYRKKLQKAAARRSRQVITSGGVEPVADGGQDGHSLFAYYLLKALKENEREFIDIENLFHTKVWHYVTEIGDQRPNVGRLKTTMDDDGQFVLIDTDSQTRKLVALAQDQQQKEQLLDLMAAKEKIEAERRRLEAEKQLIAERRSLAAERQKIEEEKQKMAAAALEAERQRLAAESKLLAAKTALKEQRKQELKKEKPPSSQLAYIPPAPLQKPPDDLFTLAFFPSKLELGGGNDVVAGFKEIIVGSKLFFPKLSYYDLGQFFIKGVSSSAVKIDNNTIPPDVIKKLWVKKSFLSPEEPNIELVCTLGKNLQVDYVILYHTTDNGWGFTEDLRVFLINAKTQKIYADKQTGVNTHSGGKGVWEESIVLTKRQ